jgi:transposase-like protein
MNQTKSPYHGYRFPPEIVGHAVWLYHRFCLSFRDVENLLAERGIVVSYETIRCWCNRFGPVCGESQFMQQWVSENNLCNEIATNSF